MITVNRLVSGVAQSVCSGESLLGLSAWHLYPDIVFLGREPTNIQQRDELVKKGGLVTIGLRDSTSSQTPGITWSMPLAHLMHYGKPVIREGSVDHKSTRVSFDKTVLATLGSAVSTWDSEASNYEKVSKFFIALSNCLNSDRGEEGSDDEVCRGWIRLFSNQGIRYIRSSKQEQAEMSRFISLGRRRYGCFLAEQRLHPLPFFGLNDVGTYIELLPIEEQVATLRDIATTVNTVFDLTNAIIRYFRDNVSMVTNRYYATPEYATLLPQPILETGKKLHRRWLHLSPYKVQNIEHDGDKDRIDEETNNTDDDRQVKAAIQRSVELMQKFGEPCGFLRGDVIKSDHVYSNAWRWHDCKVLTWSKQEDPVQVDYLMAHSGDIETTLPQDKRKLGWQIGNCSHRYEGVKCRLLFGTTAVGVWIPVDEWKHSKISLTVEYLIKAFTAKSVVPSSLIRHLSTMKGSAPYYQSLHALYAASRIYGGLTNADVDLSIMSMPLHEASWVQKLSSKKIVDLDRSHTLACVALFDTGSVDLYPEDLESVMAISSGNSLYATEILFCDPCSISPAHALRCLVGNVGRSGLALCKDESRSRLCILKSLTG